MSFTTRFTILEKLKVGCQVGWSDFESIYRPLIMLRGRDRGISSHELDDLVQQVLLNLFKSDTVYKYDKSKGRFRDYLKTVIDRRAFDLIRKHKDREKSFDELEDKGVLISSDDYEKSEVRWNREWHKSLIEQANALRRPEVSPATGDAFHMTVIENLPGDVVAQKLNISLESVYVAKHRFIKRLKPILKRLKEES